MFFCCSIFTLYLMGTRGVYWLELCTSVKLQDGYVDQTNVTRASAEIGVRSKQEKFPFIFKRTIPLNSPFLSLPLRLSCEDERVSLRLPLCLSVTAEARRQAADRPCAGAERANRADLGKYARCHFPCISLTTPTPSRQRGLRVAR